MASEIDLQIALTEHAFDDLNSSTKTSVNIVKIGWNSIDGMKRISSKHIILDGKERLK